MRTIGCLGSLMWNRTPNGDHPYCNICVHKQLEYSDTSTYIQQPMHLGPAWLRQVIVKYKCGSGITGAGDSSGIEPED